MAWGGRSGWKLVTAGEVDGIGVQRLNGLGSPVGMETSSRLPGRVSERQRLNGLGRPFGMETTVVASERLVRSQAKWPGAPVRDGNKTSVPRAMCGECG